MKNFDTLKTISEKTFENTPIYTSIINTCLAWLEKPLFEYLRKLGLKIVVQDSSHKINKEEKLFACADYNKFEITVYINKNYIKENKHSYIKQLPEAIFHEIGHIYFCILIDKCKENEELKKDIQDFCMNTDTEGGCTLFAHNYVKENYGKKLRAEGKHLINNIDIKYHENFAEFFQMYHMFQLDKNLSKQPVETDISTVLSSKAIKTKEIYEKLYLYSRTWI